MALCLVVLCLVQSEVEVAASLIVFVVCRHEEYSYSSIMRRERIVFVLRLGFDEMKVNSDQCELV